MTRTARAAIACGIVIALVGSGCVSARTSRIGSRVSLAVAGVGVVVMAVAMNTKCGPNDDPDCSDGDEALAPALAAIGLIGLGLVSAFAFAVASEPEPRREQVAPVPIVVPPPPPPPPAPDDPEDLTVRARFAARQNQCDAVQRLATRVERASAAYYRDVFAIDPGIVRCLAVRTR